MNWLATSTASHSTRLMPAASRSSTRVSMHWSAWPNSWKMVSTSRIGRKERPFRSGFGKFAQTTASGISRRRPRRLRLRNSFIHAPPCLSPLRTHGSR